MSGAPHSAQPLHGLKGAAASVMLALVFHGGALSTRDLQGATGYSDKPVRRGLAVLENMGFVRFDRGKRRWEIVAGAPLLAELTEALYEMEAAPKRPSTAERGDPGYETPAPAVDNRGDLSTGPARDGGDRGGKSADHGRKSTATEGSSSSTTAATTHTRGSRKQQRSTSEATNNAPAPEPHAKEHEISLWLIRAGVGPGSPKMTSLLKAGLDLEYVKAHVLEKIYREENAEEGERPLSVGLLIRRLEDGDPAPPMRCDRCWQVYNNGSCWCDYKDAF